MRTKDAGRPSGGLENSKERQTPPARQLWPGWEGMIFCGNVEQAVYAEILH